MKVLHEYIPEEKKKNEILVVFYHYALNVTHGGLHIIWNDSFFQDVRCDYNMSSCYSEQKKMAKSVRCKVSLFFSQSDTIKYKVSQKRMRLLHTNPLHKIQSF